MYRMDPTSSSDTNVAFIRLGANAELKIHLKRPEYWPRTYNLLKMAVNVSAGFEGHILILVLIPRGCLLLHAD